MPSENRTGNVIQVTNAEALRKKNLPNVRTGIAEKVLCITFGDLHLSHTPPVFRSAEEDWYSAMERSLKQVRDLQAKHEMCPVICTGDVFDDGWRERKCPPELINFAIKHLPRGMYAIPGQHDLPNHRLDDIRKSGFWTLVEAGTVEYLPPKTMISAGNNIMLHGYPWGVEVKNHGTKPIGGIHMAVIHDYCWNEGHTFPGAPEEKHAAKWDDRLKGFDAAVFGDNHKAFIRRRIFNGGGFMVRNSDQRDYKPVLGLLMGDGNWKVHELDTKSDVYLNMPTGMKDEPEIDFTSFMQTLEGLQDVVLNFKARLKRQLLLMKVDDSTKQVVLDALKRARKED